MSLDSLKDLLRSPFFALGLGDKPILRFAITAAVAYAAISTLQPSFAYSGGVARPFGFAGTTDSTGVAATILPPFGTSILIGSFASIGLF